MAMNPLDFLFLALFLGGILFMGGCGRKGDPVPPENSLNHGKLTSMKDIEIINFFWEGHFFHMPPLPGKGSLY